MKQHPKPESGLYSAFYHLLVPCILCMLPSVWYKLCCFYCSTILQIYFSISLILCSRSVCVLLSWQSCQRWGKEGRGGEDTTKISAHMKFEYQSVHGTELAVWNQFPFIIICSVPLCNYSCVLGVASYPGSYPGSSPCTGRSLGTRLYWEHIPCLLQPWDPIPVFMDSLYISLVDSN